MTGCTALKRLELRYQSLKTLDLSGCPNLEELDCSHEYRAQTFLLDDLDVTSNPKLKVLRCEGQSSIQSLDVSKCPELEELNCYRCNLHTLDLRRNPLIRLLDVRMNEALREIVLLEGQTIAELNREDATAIVYKPLE